MPRSGFATPTVIVISALVIAVVAGVVGYSLKSTSKPQPTPQPLSVSQLQTPQTSPAQTPALDETADWETYKTKDYSFKYPSDWTVSASGYANSAGLTNKNGSVAILISEGAYPYGFSGPMDTKINTLELTVVNKTYQAKEFIINNVNAYVDFEIDSPKSHHILFGTGYPAAEDRKASLADYYNQRATILKILSTFQFSN